MEKIWDWHHSTYSGFSRHYLLLYSIALGLESKKVLEFGSGRSSKVILEALKTTGGKLITIDERSLEETGHSPDDLKQYPNWSYLQGSSQNLLKKIEDRGFDLILHDGSHRWRTVWQDLRIAKRFLKKNAIVLIHDTKHSKVNYHLLLAVRLAFFLVPHELITLPYGNGLTIVRLKRDYGNGEISLSWQKDRSNI